MRTGMKKILIATHGMLAEGFKSSIGILLGNTDNIQTINAYTDNSVGDYSKCILKFISSIGESDEGIIFTDILGGSVNQKVCQLCINKDNIFIVTGTNLMCILSVLLENRPLTDKILKEIAESSLVSLVKMNIENKINNDTDKEQEFLG